MSPKKPRVLYLASSSITDPLIVSQVIRYLKRMATSLDACYLLTFERQTLAPQQTDALKTDLLASGIDWLPLQAVSGNRIVNAYREISNGFKQAKRLIRQHDLNLVHARSFIPGNIGLRLAKKTGIKFLYDMRGFWAEEKRAKGTINSRPVFGIAQSIERRIFRSADGLISLTQAGLRKLRADGIKTPMWVIPCCVDTDLFKPNTAHQQADKLKSSSQPDPLRLISVGSLGPGYLPEAVFGLYQAAQQRDAATELQLLTRSDADQIRAVAQQRGCDLSRVAIGSAGPQQVVDYLQNADVGLCMIQPSSAKVASSPTKLAEYLACGLPVLANAEMIGDVGQILNEHNVGTVVESLDDAGFLAAIDCLLLMRQAPDLAERCRRVAVEHFSVDVGVQRYLTAYQEILAMQK